MMEKKKRYTEIRKLTDNPYLNLYEMDALDNKGNSFSYYFASRNSKEDLPLYTGKVRQNGIVIYALCREQPDRLVMIRQYRYPLDDYIYELPAGLIDAGETAQEAAARELKEETGFDFEAYTEGDPAFTRPSFLGAGLTDETSTTVFGYAHGKISDAYLENTESIEVLLADRAEAARILRQEKLSLRAALLLIQFLKGNAQDPFGFLRL